MGAVRIIAGKYKGRKIEVIDLPGLRPTHDRIRETLFNWLMEDVPDAECLDLFAGTGALGFEALSRGAKSVTFVDSEPAVLKAIASNAERLGVHAIDTQRVRFPKQLPSLADNTFDIAFVDPPFHRGLIEPVAAWLERSGCLKKEALVYLEFEREITALELPNNWLVCRDTKTATMSAYLCRRVS